jgi:fucose 4-O-acetylase-like acetyltransferase
MPVKRKEESIETLRGIAIILMVAGHVIGDSHATGLKVGDESIWRYFYYSFEYLRMPLFTAISGFVYALKPVKKEAVFRFFKGKSRRILVPFISVATVQYAMNAFVPYVNNPTDMKEIWRIYIFGYGQFWFLQALFQVFIAIIILEVLNVTTVFKGWLISLVISALLLIVAVPYIAYDVFNFKRFLYLLPFFILGIGLNRFRDILFKKEVVVIVVIILIGSLIVQQLKWFHVLPRDHGRFGYIGVIVGIMGIFIIFRIRGVNTHLANLGYYAYGIYLFHVFGTAGSRIVSKMIGVDSTGLLLLVGLLFGLGFPILLEKYLLLPVPVLKRVFLGLK